MPGRYFLIVAGGVGLGGVCGFGAAADAVPGCA
jgi:hypothetical protein